VIYLRSTDGGIYLAVPVRFVDTGNMRDPFKVNWLNEGHPQEVE